MGHSALGTSSTLGETRRGLRVSPTSARPVGRARELPLRCGAMGEGGHKKRGNLSPRPPTTGRARSIRVKRTAQRAAAAEKKRPGAQAACGGDEGGSMKCAVCNEPAGRRALGHAACILACSCSRVSRCRFGGDGSRWCGRGRLAVPRAARAIRRASGGLAGGRIMIWMPEASRVRRRAAEEAVHVAPTISSDGVVHCVAMRFSPDFWRRRSSWRLSVPAPPVSPPSTTSTARLRPARLGKTRLPATRLPVTRLPVRRLRATPTVSWPLVVSARGAGVPTGPGCSEGAGHCLEGEV
jgi:hypothetical protein